MFKEKTYVDSALYTVATIKESFYIYYYNVISPYVNVDLMSLNALNLYATSWIWLCDFLFYFMYSPKSPQSFVICWCCKHFLGHHLEGAPRLDRLQWLWAAVAPQRCTHCLQPLQQQEIRRTHCAWASPREILSIQCQDGQWGFLENIQQTNFWICEDKYGLFCFSWLSDGMRRSSYSSGVWAESIISFEMDGLRFKERECILSPVL